MKRISVLIALVAFLALQAPALACTGCGGRFPAGVNLRLLRMRMQNPSPDAYKAPPQNTSNKVPMKPPAKKKAAAPKKPVKKKS